MPDDLVGRVIGGGKYRLTAVVARGGMATVYQAEQLNVPRQVAVKVADPVMAQDPTFVARFRQEVGAIARLEHEPHILPVYDVGQEDELLYLVMPLVTGGTLKDRLERGHGQPWPPRQALAMAQQVLSALGYAHERGFVHRDVKPSNILMEGDRLYLADFGIAKALQDSGGGATIAAPTLTGTALVGTPAYMAPEQALGRPIDARADIYSFGVVLYEVLTGRVPYQADTPMEVAFKHVQAALPPPRQLNPAMSPAIEAVLVKSLAREPDQRFATAQEFLDVFAEAVDEVDPQPVRTGRTLSAGASGLTGSGAAGRLAPPGGQEPGGLSGTQSGQNGTAAAADGATAFEVELFRRLDRVKSAQALRDNQARPPDLGSRVQPISDPGNRGASGAGSAGGISSSGGAGAAVAGPAGGAVAVEKAVPAQREVAVRNLVQPVGRGSGGSAPATADNYGTVLDAAPLQWPAGQGEAAAKREPLPRGRYRRRRLAMAGLGASGIGVAGLVALLAVRYNSRAGGAGAGPTASMSVGHSFCPAVALPNGDVLIAGGQRDERTPIAAAERYDAANNRWVSAGQMTSPRSGHAATSLSNGQVLVTGGLANSTDPLATAERYDPNANSWAPAGQMASPRVVHTATLLANGQVLVTGGSSGRGFQQSAERYDPNANSWAPAGQMASPRVWHTATLLPNGQVLVVGGYATASDGKTTYLPAAERFDPATGQWAPAGQMADSRSAHTATLLPKGHVLAVGGQNDRSILATAERYDPATDQWAPAGQMAGPRSGHAASLAGGRVLIAGGIEKPANAPALLTAERYDPGPGKWIANRASQ